MKLDCRVSRNGGMVICSQCKNQWDNGSYTCCPHCETAAATAKAKARYSAEFEAIVERHIAQYAPASVPPTDAEWYARAVHADRQIDAARAAYIALSKECWTWGAFAADDAGRLDFDAQRIERTAIHSLSLATEPGYSHAQRVEAAAKAAVVFRDEPTPEPSRARVSLGKGTSSVNAPDNAVARRGGGECSYVIFYDRVGAIVGAYISRSRRCESWAEPCAAQIAEAHFATYHYQLQPCGRTAVETTRAVIFGG